MSISSRGLYRVKLIIILVGANGNPLFNLLINYIVSRGEYVCYEKMQSVRRKISAGTVETLLKRNNFVKDLNCTDTV